jgi:hypothetical protein
MNFSDDAALREAFQHGRAQERLREAVESLRRIKAICTRQDRGALKYRLLDIEADAFMTLRRLSASTGGVIDDVEPLGLAGTDNRTSPDSKEPQERRRVEG